MQLEPKSIADQIHCLAQLTGAPESFVTQVKALFERKGISLLTDSTPYVNALEHAFRREHSIRTDTKRARESLRQTEKNFSKIGEMYVQHAKKLRRLDGSSPPKVRAKTKTSRSVTVRGDHRTFVAPTQKDQYPMVPGPDDIQ